MAVASPGPPVPPGPDARSSAGAAPSQASARAASAPLSTPPHGVRGRALRRRRAVGPRRVGAGHRAPSAELARRGAGGPAHTGADRRHGSTGRRTDAARVAVAGELVRRVPPDEAVERGHGQGGVGAVFHDRAGDTVDVLAEDERAGALDEHHDVDSGTVERLVGVHRVEDGRLGGRGVARDGGGAQDDLGPGLPARGGDGVVVGGDDDVGHQPGGEALAHRAGHQRNAADGGQVLRGDALGAAARGDHGEDAAFGSRSARFRVGHGGNSLRCVRRGGAAAHSSPIRRMTGATRCTPWR